MRFYISIFAGLAALCGFLHGSAVRTPSKTNKPRIRKNNAAQNVARLRKIALDLLKTDKTVKDTLRGKRLQATFSETILSQFLRIDYSK